MSGPKSRTPQITSQQQQAQRVPLQYQQVTSPPAIYKDDYPQQRPVYYQQLQYGNPLQTAAPSHDPSKVPQYMTSIQQAPSQQQTGPPGAPGAQGAPQGPVSQVQMYTPGRVAGAQPYTAYQPRPQSQAPRQQRPAVMNTGQPQQFYGGYQVISNAPGTHYTQHPQMQVMQGQMQPTNVVMYPRMQTMYVQAGYPVQPQTIYPTSPDGNWAIPNYGAPSPYQPQQAAQTYLQQSGGRPPSSGTQIFVQSAQPQPQPQPAAPHQPREKMYSQRTSPQFDQKVPNLCQDCMESTSVSLCDHCQEELCTKCLVKHAKYVGEIETKIAELKEFKKFKAWKSLMKDEYLSKEALKSVRDNKRQVNIEFRKAIQELENKRQNFEDYFRMIEILHQHLSDEDFDDEVEEMRVEGTPEVSEASAAPYTSEGSSLSRMVEDFEDLLGNSKTSTTLKNLNNKVSDMRTASRLVLQGDEFRFVWIGVDVEKIATIESVQTMVKMEKQSDEKMTKMSESMRATDGSKQFREDLQTRATEGDQPRQSLETTTQSSKQKHTKHQMPNTTAEVSTKMEKSNESAAEPLNNTEQPAKTATESSKKKEQPPKTPTEPSKKVDQPPKTPTEPSENVEQPPKTPTEPSKKVEQPPKTPTEPSKKVDQSPKTPTEPSKMVSMVSDQWSPLNPEGKKQYDRDFLLSLQDQRSSRTKPDNLPEIPDVILNTGRANAEQQFPKYMPKTPSFDFFTSGHVKSASSGPGSRQGPGPMNRRGSQPGGKGSRDMKPQCVIEIPVQPPVELQKAETSWIKQMKELKKEMAEKKDVADASQTEEEKETEKLFRDVRGILNKLMPQKFNKLLDQIKALEINTEKRLCGVINLIFEKAIDEPNFSVQYALLCKTLYSISVPSETQGKPVTFRVKLLARCQREFEKDRYDEEELVRRQQEIDAAESSDKKKELQLLLEGYRGKCRRRSTGNITFIGELFKLKMLTKKNMHQCLAKLLQAGGEEDLECLCRLFTTIGKGIDMGDENRSKIDEYFKRMQNIIDQKKSSSRIRFMMLDVIDLRRNNWVNRRGTNNPKTIDQIHKEAALENERAAIQEQQNRQNIKLNNPKGGGGGQNRGGPSTPRMAGSDDGWTTVQAKQTDDMSRMKLFKPTMEPDNMQLGPGFRLGPGSSWGRGSTGGSGGKSSEPHNRAGGFGIGGNRFQALGVDPRNRVTGRGMGGTPTGRMDRDSRGRPGQQGGPMGGKRGPIGARGSQEMERESALAAVRSISGGLQPRRGSLGGGSRGNSRENSRSRDGSANREYNASRSRDASPREERAPALEPGPKQLDEAAMEGKAKAILEEYLHIDDKKEALHCISELKGQKQMDVFVRECINYVLERSAGARKHTTFLLHDCIKQGLLSAEAWLSGIRSVTELGEDYEIDIPKIWQYLAELIGPIMEDEVVPLKCLTSICLPIETPSKRGILAVAVLEYISHREGHAKARSLWRKAQLNWADFVDYEGDRLEEFIKENKLEYTTADVEAHPDASLSFEKIQKALEKMLKDNARDEQIFDWVEDNVGEARRKDPKFIRALMTEVCKSAMIVTGQNPNVKYEKTALEPRAHVLQKYIDHELELELQALYAIQALVHSLEHPSGLLRYFFEELSDLEILSDEAFKAWMNSTDPKEQLGFVVAKKSVNSFLSALLADDDDDDDS